MSWQPIETAPKDGTTMDLWCTATKRRITDCWWDADYGEFIANDVNECGECCPSVVYHDNGKPTHWMPLPEPPTTDQS